MGVPKFYRWISERYPCLSEVLKEYQIPEFDNLYLDMNGIIHVCSHPDDANPHFRITEEKIFKDILHYIEVLFRMIKPKKTFFMAVDGVAPRAKMNQQRSRRFKTAREMEQQEKKALEKGETLPTEERFDSNCITPGTAFMTRLQEQLKYFVIHKMSTDILWRDVKVYLSGHETPGEGEHKIMDFIRAEKCKPGYDPNVRHCLYGLDADLMMLGLASHEPHMSLLREEVRFGGKRDKQKRSNAAEDTTFHLLHLSIMREYLDFEFSELKEKLSFSYDLECIINDWVLMGFLVGNDFIPHLPNIHIHDQCLPLLWDTYKEVLPTLDGYLHDYGDLNLSRFQKYMESLARYDIEKFEELFADLRWLDNKEGEASGKSLKSLEKFAMENDDSAGLLTANKFVTLMEEETIQEQSQEKSDDCPDKEKEEESEVKSQLVDKQLSEEEVFEAEFRSHKNHYYIDKMKYSVVTKEVIGEQCETYIKAIQWILHYYFHGCPSWSWFYPFHYAPYISDVQNFSDYKIEFDYGRPFLPFEQLMAVLPAASQALLPEPLRTLMTDEASPIYDFYPTKFETDLNGKQHDWEAVVLIPFIDENRLLEAMEPIVQHKLTPSEARRNSHGPHLLYTWIREPQGTYPSSFPNVFPDLVNYHAVVTEVPHDKFVIPKDKLMKGLCPGVKLDVHCVGYPTMRHIMHTAKILKASVRVFQQPSRGDNMILEVSPSSLKPTLNSLSEALVGKTTFVSWPHLIEALVVSVSTEKEKFCLNSDWDQNSKNVSMKREVHSEKEQALWRKQVMGIKTKYYETRGIAIGDTEFLLHARPLSGRRYTCKKHGVIHLEKQWHDTVMPFVYQTSIKNLNVRDSDYEVFETLEQLFSKGTDVFMLAVPSYGSQGKVLDIDPKNDGRIRIKFEMKREPDFEWLKHRKHKFAAKYLPGFVIAKNLGVSSYIVSRFTGIVFINAGSPDADSQKRVNVGLNLRFTRTGQEVPGYSKKTEDQGWLFSTQTRDILRKYIERYPEVFGYMAVNTSEPYYESEILDGLPYTLHDISQFLDELPSSKTAKVDHGTDVLDERVVQEIVKATKDIQEQNESRQLKPKIIQVRPYLLHRPLDAQDSHIPDSTATYEVFDRVVCVHHAFTVPLGYTGTVIGIHPAENPHEILYEVIFDKEFLGGLTLMGVEGRGYRMPLYTLINLSHGKRLEKNGPDHHRPTAVIKPHQKRQLSSQPHTNNAHNQPNSQSHANNAHNQPRPQRQNNRQDFKMPPRFQQQISSNSSSHDSNVLEYHSGQVGQEIMSTGNHTEPHTHGVGRGSDISRMLITDTTNNTAFVGGLNNRHDQEPPRHPATLISSNVDYQVLWQKLQQANLTGGHGAEPPATPRAPHSNSTSQSTPLQNITLDMAAKALPNLSVPPPPLPTTDASRSPQKPATGQAIDPQTLFKMTGNTRVDLSTQDYPAAPQSQSGTEGQQSTESNEFVGMMAALELKAKQEMEVKKKGTAELRQMLNIETSETTSPKKKRSSIEMLEELCQTQKWEQPQFSYTHDHNRRVRCTVTFVNGAMYAGNLFDNEPKAAESAAQSALVELTPKQSTNNFNSSPNSAFTPIRNEFTNGKVPSWNPYHDNHQQNYPRQQQHTAGVHHPMMRLRHQAFMPQRQMPPQQQRQAHHRQQLRHPEQLYYMPPRQQYQRFAAQQRYQNHPTGVVPHHGNNWAHPNWQQQQQLMQQQQMQQQQHQGSNKTPRKHNDGYSDPSRSTERTPPKSNPFVPLQAVKHSKSPRKKTTSTSESSVDSKQQTAKADASNRTAGAADEQQPQQEQAQAKDANDTTPPQQHTQGSRTFTNSDKKKKSRRLAANFGAAKPSS